MLIATLRDKGKHPCPHCRITFDEISGLGTHTDRELREEKARKDDELWRRLVEDARKLMYKDGYAVNGDTVNNILKDISGVPTKVM